MKTRLVFAFLLLNVCASLAFAQQAQTVISGTIHTVTGDPDPNGSLTVYEVRKIGSINSAVQQTFRTNSSGQLLHTDGSVGIKLPRNSQARVWSNAPDYGFNKNAGVWVVIPDTATANLQDLPIIPTVSAGIRLQDEDTLLPSLIGKIKFVGSGVTVAQTTPGSATVTITGSGSSALDDLSDVIIASPASGQFLRNNGFAWLNAAIGASDLPGGIDASKIGGGGVNTTEFNFLADITSDVQNQINNKQPLAQNLTDIAGLSDPNANRLIFWDDSAGAYAHLTLGTNLSITGTTLNAAGGGGDGSGHVVGPSSATDHAVARFDLTTGKLIKNSSVLINDNGGMTIVGGADASHLIVRAHSSQTVANPLLTFQKSDGSALFGISSDHPSNLYWGFETGINNLITGNGEEGLGNVYIGYQSGKSSPGQHTIRNTGVGFQTLTNLQTQNGQHTAVGFAALTSVTTGTKDTAIGVVALLNCTTCNNNQGIGVSALRNLIDGTGNFAGGNEAMYNSVHASGSSVIGLNACHDCDGDGNSVVGSNSFFVNSSGSGLVGVGALSGFGSTTGNYLTLIGFKAGEAIMTSSHTIVIGADIDAPSDTDDNQLNIGNIIFGTGVDGVNKTISTGSIGIAVASPVSGAKLDVRGHLALTNAGTANEIRLYEPSGSGSNYTAFKAQAQSANQTYTLPNGYGTSGQVWTTDGAGGITWTTISGGGGGGSPAGSGAELQYRVDSSTFGAVSGSSVSGGDVTINNLILNGTAGNSNRSIYLGNHRFITVGYGGGADTRVLGQNDGNIDFGALDSAAGSTSIRFFTGGNFRWILDDQGQFWPGSNNALDIGQSGFAIRSLYIGTSLIHGGFTELAEISAPSSPAADKVRFYAEDNGSGKTRIVAKFPDGSTAVIVTQP